MKQHTLLENIVVHVLSCVNSFRVARGDSVPNLDIMRPLPKEPDSDHKKKISKSRVTGKLKTRGTGCEDKPEISYPTNFEHTMHVGFDAHTGEFTVSRTPCSQNCLYYLLLT